MKYLGYEKFVGVKTILDYEVQLLYLIDRSFKMLFTIGLDKTNLSKLVFVHQTYIKEYSYTSSTSSIFNQITCP